MAVPPRRTAIDDQWQSHTTLGLHEGSNEGAVMGLCTRMFVHQEAALVPREVGDLGSGEDLAGNLAPLDPSCRCLTRQNLTNLGFNGKIDSQTVTLVHLMKNGMIGAHL